MEGETKTQEILENIENPAICLYLYDRPAGDKEVGGGLRQYVLDWT